MNKSAFVPFVLWTHKKFSWLHFVEHSTCLCPRKCIMHFNEFTRLSIVGILTRELLSKTVASLEAISSKSKNDTKNGKAKFLLTFQIRPWVFVLKLDHYPKSYLRLLWFLAILQIFSKTSIPWHKKFTRKESEHCFIISPKTFDLSNFRYSVQLKSFC